jgi:hypothetical protein
MPDLDVESLSRNGVPMLVLAALFWLLRPFFANWSETHKALVSDVSATNKVLAATQQQMAVTMENLSTGQEQTHRHIEQAHAKLDQLLQRKA